MDLTDIALAANQAFVTGTGLWTARQAYQRARGTRIPVVTPNTGESAMPRAGYLRSGRKRGSMKAKNLRGSKRPRRLSYGPTPVPSIRSGFRRTNYFTTLGLRPGRYPSKKHNQQSQNASLIDKVQYVDRLIRVPYSDTEQMNARQGRLANVRGVKFRAWFNLKNQSEISDKLDVPIMVRWAILLPKDNQGLNGDVGPDNFFISADPEGEEATDFSAAENCFGLQNRQINRRKYGVMQQGKFILSQNPASTNSRLGTHAFKALNLWLPVKRQMKWSSNTVEFPNTNIYFVLWYTKLGDKNTGAQFTDGPLEFHWEALTYFKDSLGFI